MGTSRTLNSSRVAMLSVAYGTLNDHNGVTVNVSATGGYPGSTYVSSDGTVSTANPTGQNIQVTFNPRRSSDAFACSDRGGDQPLRLITDVTDAGLPGMGRDSVNYTSWEVPVVAKYRFLHTPVIKPFAEAGPNFRFLNAPLDHFIVVVC
jgi:hypothetical protein